MSGSYRVQYSNQATDALRKMTGQRRARFLAEVATVAKAPYQYGVALGGVRDRREATLAGAATVFWVSRSVLTISVVTVVHPD